MKTEKEIREKYEEMLKHTEDLDDMVNNPSKYDKINVENIQNHIRIREDCLTKTHHEDEIEELKLQYRNEWLDGLGVIPKRTREPFPLPTLMICDDMRKTDGFKVPFDELDHSLLKLIDYQSHSTIKAPLSN